MELVGTMELYDAIDVTLIRCLSTPISRGAEDSADLQSFLPHNIHCNTTEHLFTFTPDVFYTTPFYQKSMAHDQYETIWSGPCSGPCSGINDHRKATSGLF